MKKAVLLYGLCGGLSIAALRLVEYRFLVTSRVDPMVALHYE